VTKKYVDAESAIILYSALGGQREVLIFENLLKTKNV